MFFIISTSEIKQIAKFDECSVPASERINIAYKHSRYESSTCLGRPTVIQEAKLFHVPVRQGLWQTLQNLKVRGLVGGWVDGRMDMVTRCMPCNKATDVFSTARQ